MQDFPAIHLIFHAVEAAGGVSMTAGAQSFKYPNCGATRARNAGAAYGVAGRAAKLQAAKPASVSASSAGAISELAIVVIPSE